MVVFDTSILIDLLNSKIIGDRRAQLDHLVETLQKSRITISIPTPVLSELMAKAGGAKDKYFQTLTSNSNYRFSPFGTKAAMECAFMIERTITGGDKKNNSKTWAKSKFDWQIVAIAKAENASIIYSEDGDIARIGARENIKVMKINDLPLPATARQKKIDFDPK